MPDSAPGLPAFARDAVRGHSACFHAGRAAGNVFSRILLAAALLGARGSLHAEGFTPADCDGAESARVLHPAADPRVDARAIWLDATTLQWPGKPADGRYRLVSSRVAALGAQAGEAIRGVDASLTLQRVTDVAPDTAARFRHLTTGVQLRLNDADATLLRGGLDAQWWLVHEDASGKVLDSTHIQAPGLLDAAFDGERADVGLRVDRESTRFALWAPTARQVGLCLYEGESAASRSIEPLRREDATGTWHVQHDGDLRGVYYSYLVDVYVPGTGLVRNRVTDPYSIALATGSTRSSVLDLDDVADPALAPPGWATHARPAAAASNVDMAVYELHVRDFSIGDASVPAAHRGKYLGFTAAGSNGMRHLRDLRRAGLTDIHLLPVFDIATVPERGCVTPRIPAAAADSRQQQAAVSAVASTDCFNWGYDPYHFGAPEGSYATPATQHEDAAARRILEFRAMVQALHGIGLRVGMDVVYNHTTTSGQAPTSVLDRIVPGYYHRLDANGAVTRSTCCENTATEHRMMARLMADTLAIWVKHYGIDSFRFDLMGHQPRASMERARAALRAAVDREVPLIGEGWNFGEVADGARFVQAAQGRLDSTGIATFSDRARDALRGGGCCDSGVDLLRRQGWLNGMVDAPNGHGVAAARAEVLHTTDLIRAGLAGTLRSYVTTLADGRKAPLTALDYAGKPAGYASSPEEVVNYVENHDNATLFDINALRLPADTTIEDRARVQMLGIAMVALSQGMPYHHAGIDVLRSKSLDRNSYDSGDHFNRLDWTYADNGFAAGLPRQADNGKDWPLLAPVLRNTAIKPAPRDIAWMRDVFRDWLRLRAETPLLRLRDAAEVRRRLTFANTGPAQDPAVMVGHLDGREMPGARFDDVLYLVNTSPTSRTMTLPDEAGKRYVLHPVLREGRDARVRAARSDGRGGFSVPGRTAAVFVVDARTGVRSRQPRTPSDSRTRKTP